MIAAFSPASATSSGSGPRWRRWPAAAQPRGARKDEKIAPAGEGRARLALAGVSVGALGGVGQRRTHSLGAVLGALGFAARRSLSHTDDRALASRDGPGTHRRKPVSVGEGWRVGAVSKSEVLTKGPALRKCLRSIISIIGSYSDLWCTCEAVVGFRNLPMMLARAWAGGSSRLPRVQSAGACAEAATEHATSTRKSCVCHSGRWRSGRPSQ